MEVHLYRSPRDYEAKGMDAHNVPEAQPDPDPGPDVPEPEPPPLRRVPPESQPKAPGGPAVPDAPQPPAVPPGAAAARDCDTR